MPDQEIREVLAQSIISVEAASAAKEYRFHLDLPSRAVASIEGDGTVSIRDEEGNLLGGYSAPWAFDANGGPVETSYAIVGRDLIQKIEHGPGTAYPIVADPNDFWGWAVCVAKFALVLSPWGAGAGIAARLVARFGSVKRGMEIMVNAWNHHTHFPAKWAAIMAVSGGIAGEIIGIEDIRVACFT